MPAAPTTSPEVTLPSKTPTKDMASAATFAASGFAALANSSMSSFSNTVTMPSNPAQSFLAAAEGLKAVNEDATKGPRPPQNEELRSSTENPASWLNRSDSSPLNTTGPVKPGIFGASASGFGVGFGVGSKLANFAAPKSDSTIGESNGTIKPIGSPKYLDESKAGSGSEREGKYEDSDIAGGSVIDERFQHQDSRLIVSV